MSIKISKQQAEEILESIDKTIKNGPWDKSNFLKAIGKNLQEIRDDFHHKIHAEAETIKKQEHISQPTLKPGQIEIFVSLYSTNGSSLQTWERILMNLPKQIISRPIYADEEAIKTVIKSKENRLNEAYISLFISETSLLELPQDKISYDKLGQPLLTLKNNAIHIENINRFEHTSGTYLFVNSRLLRQT